MNGAPETRYVGVGEADVAYQVVGNGPIDLLYLGGVGSHIELQWDYPSTAATLLHLASFSRLIYFDRRGTGGSDGVARNAMPTWEEWTEDVGAVLDAAGSERAAIFAETDTGPIAILFAATHPERVSALVLGNTSARYLVADDYPIGASQEEADALVELLGGMWGTADLVRAAFPDMASDEEFVRFLSEIMRAAATPRTAAAQYRYILQSLDVRPALPLVQAPTLILHYGGNPIVPMAHGRYIADHIGGAKFVELPGQYTQYVGPDTGDSPDEIAEFLTGERTSVEVDRVLTTVVFTDIVGSTERAAAMGDRRWRTLLDTHDRAVRERLRQFRGHEIKTTGDGFLVSFDGPARAIRCARAITEAARALGIEVRAGLHAGECEVRGDDLGGLAVHIAARVGALAAPGEVLVSSTVKDLVAGSGIEFADRGTHALKGVPDEWKVYGVEHA